MLSCGIVGLPMTGKTTVYNLLTKNEAETSAFFTGKTSTNIGIANIPDKRLEYLSSIFEPKKTVYADLQVVDIAGLVKGSSSGAGVGNSFIEDIRQTDALIHVIRAFNDPDIPHSDNSINPMRDVETIDMELLFADLDFVEKRIDRISKGKKITPEQKSELEVLKKLALELNEGKPYYQIELSKEEKELMQNYTFLTNKPMILVVNVDEEQLIEGTYEGKSDLEQFAKERNMPLLMLSAKIEVEISALDKDDQAEFMQDLNISESGVFRLARTVYGLLNLISFFTVGKDECRAWTISNGLNAAQAAGKIHSDLERGFIRAETVSYQDFVDCGSIAVAKEKGLWRLEGRNYIVLDGDIISVRFNV